MSVNEGERGIGRLAVLVKARELSVYTLNITKNKNIFVEDFQSSLIDKINDYAINIFMCAWQANEINVGKSIELLEKRQWLQKQAIINCSSLLSLIYIAQSVFHLKTKRIKYWSKLILETKSLLKLWTEADKKRYSVK